MPDPLMDELDDLVDGIEPPTDVPATSAEAPAEKSGIEDYQFQPGLPIYFDAETGPESSVTLERFFKFDAGKVKNSELIDQEFDPSTVKYGRLKDPDKKKAKLEETQEAFEKKKQAAIDEMKGAIDKQWEEFVSRAPLSPLHGQVLAIGYGQGLDVILDVATESTMLDTFWDIYAWSVENGCKLVGYNCNEFDVPFFVRRSWKLGVSVPQILERGRYMSSTFVDLHEVWRVGKYREYTSLNDVALHLGTPVKTGDGADFHRLFNSETPEDRAAALEYLRNDIVMTREVAAKLLGG